MPHPFSPGSVAEDLDVSLLPVSRAALSNDLAAIRRPEIVLANCSRTLPTELATALDLLDAASVDDLAFSIEFPISAAALAMNLVVSGYESALSRLLAADIAELATRFAAITRSTRLAVRLEIVETDACRRFHADHVTYRLLSTYRGQATQWIRANEPDDIQHMRTGDVGIFKGRVLAPDTPILHRSPPIAGTGEQRLLLVIDAVTRD